eukprot:CAMPEP_0116133338 /NCGR_PEP_ID=MMETSP0329-20121206/10050_1 /TAXON_ID=697910 /ORGANISM="Pseudo-nitzschia arenysensis, Strain B593" /LENGTH=421 /DNA_ID=CAMNT_0003627957 /DNA_START=108 /DNA_END=1373 /DNA_ORIENTATION=+
MTDQQETYARAPPLKLSLYDEAYPTLYMSLLVFVFPDIIKYARNGELDLKYPEDFSIKESDFEQFRNESADLTKYNDGNGLSFYEIDVLIRHNRKALLKVFEKEALLPYLLKLIERIRKDISSNKHVEGDPMKKIFLTHHRSIQEEIGCVYCVVKDTIDNRIIATFRGSQTGKDWGANVNFQLKRMDTPEKIKDMMKGNLKRRVLVQKGFWEYLFQNEDMKKNYQRFDNMTNDIRAAIKNEPGYNVCITGHSLGAALATMFSFQLAGAGKAFDDIPRPITCISWAAPFSGTAGYRTAMECLEQKGLLRHLRVTVAEDLIPTLLPFSLLWTRAMKHTGINLRLQSSAPGYILEHSSRSNFKTAIRNSLFKPISTKENFHQLPFHEERMEAISAELRSSKLELDKLYKDKKVVSQVFIDGSRK